MSRYLLHFAFEYHDRGWPIVPVNGKIPAVPWATYQRKRPSLDQVRGWFLLNENHNLAVVTGKTSGLVVIDCDTARDATWWRKNRSETPLVVTTGRGGRHFYYRYPRCEVGNKAGILGRKIDVRGEGGLVVAPPSIHPATKRTYCWQPWDYYSLDEVPLFDPAWLGPASVTSEASCSRVSSRDIQNGFSYIRQITAESGNGGHNATFRAACKLRDSGLTPAEALDALRSWNETNAAPPWTDKELAHKIHDAFKEHHHEV